MITGNRNSGRGIGAVRWIVLAALLLAIVGLPTAASGQPTGGPPAGGAARGAWADGGGRTYRITLITGDVAVLQVTSDGRQAAWLESPARKRPAPQVYELNGQVHVVPAEAAPYVAAGALDEKLFNVTLLAQHGYDDRSTKRLPLLLEGSATGDLPRVPAGARQVRELASVGMVSVTAEKEQIRETWDAIRGARPADYDAADATLAGADKVWLNGRVRANLDESVPQIGAPEAWAKGYDGSGVTVAVLDTGYDPSHPDLQDQVVGSRDFTGSPTGTAVDGNGHGTHVAATVAGTGAASDGTRKGVAPGAELLIGKVLDDQGSGFEDQIIAGMEWAASHGADVVNLSLGTAWPTDGSDGMSQAVNRLTEETGTLFVAAAGNSGPFEQTVGSPGAADHALTVGAVTKDDAAAWFSSRGPRLGDGAIKPEITAPGAAIVAARAAGTSLGNLLDEHYTSLDGTSMATPHVAGAAAILAQQHPAWSAEELKTRLVSTSVALEDEPITFQGGGRLDVAAATSGHVSVSDAVLSLGRMPQSTEAVTRTLTYSNDSAAAVRLRLTADVTSTGADQRETPALTLSQKVLTVPAHGTASVVVSLRPDSTEPGGYAGRVVAQPVGSPRAQLPALHTALAFVIDGPLHTVTVEALDRDGQPASGPVDLWSADTGEWQRGFLQEGATTFAVPEGLYSLVASIEAGGELFSSTQHTIAGNPELTVDGDMTLRYDARDARPLTVTTPREAERARFDLLWHRSVGDRSMSMIITQGWSRADEIYLLKSKPARTGTFTFASEWLLSQPLLVAQVVGSDGFRITSPEFASPPTVYAGDESLRLVDAGTGSADEFAAVDTTGAVALVSRGDWGVLAEQAERAAAAGAKLLFAYNTSDEMWGETVFQAPLPIFTLDRQTGAALLDALAANPDLMIDLAGVGDATYQYYLTFAEERRIPHGRTYDVGEDSLAAVTSDYRQNSDRMVNVESWIPYIDGIGVGNSMATVRNGPVVRTDYVTADGVDWQRFGQPHEFLGLYWTFSDPERYEAGKAYNQLWWGPLVGPGVPPTAASEDQGVAFLAGVGAPVARHRDAIRVNLAHYYYGGSLRGTIFEQAGDRSEVTLTRDGEVIGKSSWPLVQFTVPPSEGEYELRLDVVNGEINWSDTSVHTETVWRFRSARTDEPRTVLPLLQLEYELDTDAYNAMPSGTSYPLRITPGYQPGATGPGGFSGAVEVSFDDGETWAAVLVRAADGVLEAQIPAASGPGFASVRVVVTDADGNQLTQRIDRGWRISES